MFGDPQQGDLVCPINVPSTLSPFKYTKACPTVVGILAVPLSITVQYNIASTKVVPGTGVWILIVPEPTFLNPMPACTKPASANLKDGISGAVTDALEGFTEENPLLSGDGVVAELSAVLADPRDNRSSAFA